MANESEQLAAAVRSYAEGRYEDAYRNYSLLAENGLVDCQVFVGWMTWRGLGVKPDETRAMQWFDRAARANNPEAQFYLARIHETKGTNLALARELYEKAAQQGDLPALYRLAQMYKKGFGVERNPEKAMKLFQQAAQRGHLFAKREVAVHLMKGQNGILKIPAGILMFIRTVLEGFKVGLSDDLYDQRAFR
jgi:TPR repeat protein